MLDVLTFSGHMSGQTPTIVGEVARSVYGLTARMEQWKKMYD